MKKQITIEQLIEKNKDVLERLKTCGDEYYTVEQAKKKFRKK